uniref:NAD(P)-dependent oxidoreductase n=2 Tax=Paracidobacterium acidisoli TaxID=2303751 RepID=A0A372ISU2_9BACT
MRIAVIGGTGHIGSYLTPLLYEAGHDVVCVSRGTKKPYQAHPAWAAVTHVRLDRTAEENAGSFGERIARIEAEVVVDLTCYQPKSAEMLVEGLRGRVRHLLHCGTIWVHGHGVRRPTTEDEPRQPFGDYGVHKAAIEAYLLREAKENGLPVTVLHPGHLVGPGWAPINPAGNFNTNVFAALKRGEEIRLPHFGLETVHHVHAKDVAWAFLRAMERREAALGESFHVVSAAAVTLRGYAESMAEWFGKRARIAFLPWEEWKQEQTGRDAAVTEDHIRHSPQCSIEKARRLLGYEPGYSSLEAVQEAVSWLIENGAIV